MWDDILVYRDRPLLWVFPLKLHNLSAKILETAYVTSVRRAVDEIILAKAVTHRLTSIGVTQNLTITLYTNGVVFHRANAVGI